MFGNPYAVYERHYVYPPSILNGEASPDLLYKRLESRPCLPSTFFEADADTPSNLPRLAQKSFVELF
jgi:hypothetical protein